MKQKVLIINLNKHDLAYHEFITPIISIIKEADVVHYKESYNPNNYDKIILGGTPLKDNEFLENIKLFNWIDDFKKPVLGICAGAEVIALRLKCRLTTNKSIGLKKIKTINNNPLFKGEFEAYCLHSLSVELRNEKGYTELAENTEAFMFNNLYGIMFHPEVRNIYIVKKFINL